MKLRSKLGIAILLFSNAFLLSAQDKPPTSAKEMAPLPPISVGGGNLEVLSDTMGVDFGPYFQRILHNVRVNWYSQIPGVARDPIMKKGKLKIEFTILKDGRIAGMQRVASSGDISLDRAAWGGITASAPFPPLPSEFGGQYLALRMTFLYNPSLKGLTPSVIQVNTGTSQQFSPVLQRVPDPAVFHINWSVQGFHCTADSCGTVSATGLYTAPATIPSPTNVTVIAKAEDDLGEEASATVTIVPPKSPPQ